MQQEQPNKVMPNNRSKCANSCCEVVTKSLCVSCEKQHVCNKHKKCDSCKNSKTIVIAVQKMEIVSAEEDKKDKARERARNYYRLKQGIPVDAPLIQRGGAHNVKYHTEAEKAERAKLEKEYQKEYQQKYREKKAKMANEAPVRQTLPDIHNAILAKQDEQFTNLINELVEELKESNQGK